MRELERWAGAQPAGARRRSAEENNEARGRSMELLAMAVCIGRVCSSFGERRRRSRRQL